MIESLKDVISKRTKGLYGGTFILIWIIYNWKLLYKIFNFESYYNLDTKVAIIECYIEKNLPWRLLWCPVIATLISIISYNVLNNISYTVNSFFNYRVRPFIISKVKSNKIVMKDRYDILEKNYFELEKEYSDKKQTFVKNEDENKALHDENTDKTTEIKNLKGIVESLQESNKNLNEGFNTTLTEITNKLQAKETELFELKTQKILNERIIDPIALFPGFWEKSFHIPGQTVQTETFSINGNVYIINGVARLKIEYIKIYDEKIIELKKVSIDNRGVLINLLIKINDNYFIGIENENIRVEYKRQIIR